MSKAAWLAAALLLCMTPMASASVAISLDDEFSGGATPQGSAPWVTLLFEEDGANQVKLTVSAFLTGTEIMAGLWFNYDGDVADLSFSQGSGPATDFDNPPLSADG